MADPTDDDRDRSDGADAPEDEGARDDAEARGGSEDDGRDGPFVAGARLSKEVWDKAFKAAARRFRQYAHDVNGFLQDVLKELLIRWHKGDFKQRFETEYKFQAYLRLCIERKCLRWMDRQRPTIDLTETGDLPDSNLRPPADILQDRQIAIFWKAFLGEQKPADRRALELYYEALQDDTRPDYDAIAEAVCAETGEQRTAVATRQQVYRLRQRFRELLAKNGYARDDRQATRTDKDDHDDD